MHRRSYGGEIVRASRLMHGKASTITHNGNSLFSDLASSSLFSVISRTVRQ